MRLPISPLILQKGVNRRIHYSPSAFKLFHPLPISQARDMASCENENTVLGDLALNCTATSDLNIENTNIKTASGVSLDDHQKTLVGSVLDVSRTLGFVPLLT